MAPNHGGDPLGSILGPMESHWVPKMGQNRKKLPCPEIRIFCYPAVIDFSQKSENTVMAPNHGGDTLGSFLGPMGSHWVQKIEFLATPRSSIYRKKSKLLLWHKSRWVIDFSQKIAVTVMAPNHCGDPLGSILGPMGSHWVQKKSQNRKNIPCPKIGIFGHRFFAKNRSYGYGAKSRCGTPRVHLGANGVPLGPKNGSKP